MYFHIEIFINYLFFELLSLVVFDKLDFVLELLVLLLVALLLLHMIAAPASLEMPLGNLLESI